MGKKLVVYCPCCDVQFEIEIEEKSCDLENGQYVLCSKCFKNVQNGELKESENIDMYPGDHYDN